MKFLFSIFLQCLYFLPNGFSSWLYQKASYNYGKIARYVRVASISRLANRQIDRSCNISTGVIMKDIEKLRIGKDVTINERCFISAYGGVTIGSSVSIGHDTTILSSDHVFNDGHTMIKGQGITGKETRIDDDVYIGCKCIILGGVEIGSGSIIGAGSVVTKNVEKNTVVAGNPCKVIRER